MRVPTDRLTLDTATAGLAYHHCHGSVFRRIGHCRMERRSGINVRTGVAVSTGPRRRPVWRSTPRSRREQMF